ncbi:proline-rich protein 23A-like [Zalophus californianus]|uniref:Proline-rich protein 23A-like n=1 Tax=Zalophus californianus TaxID=9704 RepID=A0A6J2CGX0_ZALCA|nr:proline-rich protein 23A-like [Zalophus californianus]
MGSRPRSPSAHPEPCWGPPPGGPRPAKRRRTEEPEGLEGLGGPPAAGALTSVVVLATGCALQLLLDDVDLVLEPEPTSALQVTLGELTLVLVPEALLRSGGQGHSPAGLELGAFLNAPGHQVAVEQGFFCAPVPEMAAQEEAYEEDADPEFLPPGTDPAAGSVLGLRPCAGGVASPHPQDPVPDPWPWAPTPSPKRRSLLRYFNLDAHLLEPFPNSPLQPLPPSPSPGPHARPQRPPGASRKARRRLFQE